MAAATRKSPALLALTSAALALPGYATADPAAGILRSDYQFTAYREGEVEAAQAASGRDEARYRIDTHQFALSTALSAEFELDLGLAVETMSGATPWFVAPDANQRPVQVMSGATIAESRAEVQAELTRRYDRSQLSVRTGLSTEDDYRALSLGVQYARETADRATTLSLGLGYSKDRITPVDADSGKFPTRLLIAHRDSTSLLGGVSRILGPNTAVQTSLQYTRHNGFLSDPYKLAYVDGNTVADARPSARNQWAWLTRLRHYFAKPAAALHLDYRFYADDWELAAHTVELAWHQNLAEGWRLVPGLRWYSQSQAAFYAPFYDAARADGYAASDYRLSPYGALSARLGVDGSTGAWQLHFAYESYQSAGSLALGEVRVENPGLVDFQVFSFSVSRAF